MLILQGCIRENWRKKLPINWHTIRQWPFFYRTAAGAEIDLLLEVKPGLYWAIEIKAGRTPNVKPGFHRAAEDLGVAAKFVIYTGEDSFMLRPDTTVMSLPRFMEELKVPFPE